ncbi:MAG: hypothetical protein ABTR27_01890 [Candidatus Competibacter phosphatis]
MPVSPRFGLGHATGGLTGNRAIVVPIIKIMILLFIFSGRLLRLTIDVVIFWPIKTLSNDINGLFDKLNCGINKKYCDSVRNSLGVAFYGRLDRPQRTKT